MSWPSGPNRSPESSRDGRACWPFANDSSTPPRMTSGRSARRGFPCSWAWSATPNRSLSSKTRPSIPPAFPLFTTGSARIVERHGVTAACYGHADVGCLHIRPLINVKTRDGVETLRSIAREVCDLVVEFGGAMSGEHGDGLARSLWNRKLFGPEVYAAFQAVKHAFDPREPAQSRQGRG